MGPHNACSYADLALIEEFLTLITGQTMFCFHPIGQDFVMTVSVFGLKVYHLY